MKHSYHINLITNILFACLLSMAAGCSDGSNGSKEQPGGKLAILKNEDGLNLDLHVVDEKIAEAEMKNCALYIHPDAYCHDSLPRLITVIDSAHFDTLRVLATANADGCDSNYVTGIKIFFGLNSACTEIELLYKPFYSCRNGISADSCGHYDVHETSDYYQYDGSEFTITTDTSCLANYRSHIKIQDPPNTSCDTFHNNYDAEAVIYPFAEIDKLMGFNSPPHVVSFWNIAIKDNTSVRHSILLGPDPNAFMLALHSEQTVYVTGGGTGKTYENLAHLCPPNCSPLKYKLK